MLNDLVTIVFYIIGIYLAWKVFSVLKTIVFRVLGLLSVIFVIWRLTLLF